MRRTLTLAINALFSPRALVVKPNVARNKLDGSKQRRIRKIGGERFGHSVFPKRLSDCCADDRVVFRGNRSVTVAALIGAARVSKRFPDTVAALIGAARVSKRFPDPLANF
jgi:hypothetical protein